MGTYVAHAVPVVLVCIAIAWQNRGAVRVAAIEGSKDAPTFVLRFGEALDEVAEGAKAGTEVDNSLRLATEVGMPTITIPGTGMTLATLVSFLQVGVLRETQIRGASASEGSKYRVRLQIDGPGMRGRTVYTEPMNTEDEAIVAGATEVYRVLEPLVAAFYLFSRYPDRALDVVREMLRDKSTATDDRSAAYRIWGLVLRDRGDYDEARAKLKNALDNGSQPDSKSKISVDIGYTFLLERKWLEAAAAFREATQLDPGRASPWVEQADALRQAGELDEAVRLFETAANKDPLAFEPWRGVARTRRAQARYAEAVEAFVQARSLTSAATQQASLTYELGDMLFGMGRRRAAAREYVRAFGQNPANEAARLDFLPTLACQGAQPEDVVSCEPDGSSG